MVLTDEERVMLREIYDALLKPPVGSNEKALLEEIRTVVKAYQRASWATRAIVWLLPAIAGVGVAFEKIRGWLG